MTWTTDDDSPAWLSDLALYQIEQGRALDLGIWPRETALRFRAISSTLTAALANQFAELIAKKKRDGEIDVFPPLSSASLAEISATVTSALLAGSWLQSTRALMYLDDHPRKDH